MYLFVVPFNSCIFHSPLISLSLTLVAFLYAIFCWLLSEKNNQKVLYIILFFCGNNLHAFFSCFMLNQCFPLFNVFFFFLFIFWFDFYFAFLITFFMLILPVCSINFPCNRKLFALLNLHRMYCIEVLLICKIKTCPYIHRGDGISLWNYEINLKLWKIRE